MLHELVRSQHDEIVARARAKVAKRRAPIATEQELEHGVPLFLGQLVEYLIRAGTGATTDIDASATIHGGELLRVGFTIAQVVHGYGDVCQAVTELVHEQRIVIGAEEYRLLNLALVEELEVTATVNAKPRGLHLYVSPVDYALEVSADRSLLASAIGNLVQNAIKFTHANSTVTLKTTASGERVMIEVEDECGGLPSGKAEELFRPFEQRGEDRTGMGMGLAISKRAVDANGGTLSVRDLPARGCVFVVDLPRLRRGDARELLARAAVTSTSSGSPLLR